MGLASVNFRSSDWHMLCVSMRPLGVRSVDNGIEPIGSEAIGRLHLPLARHDPVQRWPVAALLTRSRKIQCCEGASCK
jgi:hypothetical protein